MRTPVRPVITRGFTLLEVMLALLLLAVLLAGSVGAIRTAVRAMHSGELAIDRTSRLRVAQEFIRHQVSRIMPLAFARDDNTGSNFVFDGRRDFMRFVAPMPGYLSKGGPYVQTLSLAGNRRGGRELLFTAQMLNGYEADHPVEDEPSVLLDQIADGHFEFRTIDENGELTDWSDQWDDPGVTPVMVRIVLRMSDQARIEFPVMDIPLMLDAGAVRRPTPFSMPGMRMDERQNQPRRGQPQTERGQ
ncbi:prepilin-type N-terminal cleavage/methylation domain-containing protein [Dokdonella sp.]|uniref:prepilin-type N-terminal cleavage/methylation domain-containing protein n=1 Tax=Dokdonella sp. TaxID=2291710 RepID=UPI0025C0E4C9|nr:prepilin-type N-terminal cleavage/methylation domain-containing protein [Dokdonella sp.]MBX3689861.1 prepilin-type N-terminal cleavage/methylation domain-containing protein [Dokdonella sp.]